MGLFDKFRKHDTNTPLSLLMQTSYEQRYFKECQFLWREYVPDYGQCNVLQGELLREVEKLRYEAQNNQNIDWDEDFSHFCDFLRENLCCQDFFSEEEKQNFALILGYFQECGSYAAQWHSGGIAEKDLDRGKLAYLHNNLYDILADAAGRLQAEHPDPIPHEINPDIKR